MHRHLKALASALAEIESSDIASVRSLLRRIALDTTIATRSHCRLGPRSSRAGRLGSFLKNLIPGSALVYCHGLSFMAGDLATYGGFASRLAASTRACTLFVEYRLAPEYLFPAAHEDCRTALSWAQTHGPDCADAAKCVVAGDSCGASLAIGSALAASREGTPASAVVLFSPFVDLSVSGDSWQRNEGRDPILTADIARDCGTLYAPGVNPRDHRLSPVFADLSGLPPLQIHASAADPMFDDATQLLAACNRAGVLAESHVWSDIPHLWVLFSWPA